MGFRWLPAWPPEPETVLRSARMPSPRFLFLFIVAILVACTALSPPPPPPLPDPEPAGPSAEVRIVAMSWNADGTSLWMVVEEDGVCSIERRSSKGDLLPERYALSFCPESLRRLPDGSLLAAGRVDGVRVGATLEKVPGLLDVSPDGEKLERAPGGLRLGGNLVEFEGELLGGRWIPQSSAVLAAVRQNAGESLLRVERDGQIRAIAGPFPAIDSWDLDPHGLELVLSARREDGFDVGIVSTEGSEVAWIAPDLLDERMVSWAPRGTKVTFRIDSGSGSVLRTVHIPTGFQLAMSFPGERVSALAWEPQAERFALAIASPSSSWRVDMVRYGGEERAQLVRSRTETGFDPDQLAGVPGGVVLAPAVLRYGERVPVVVWLAEDPLAWSGHRARLQKNRNVGTVVVPSGAGAERDWWDAVTALSWADPDRVFVVSPVAGTAAAAIPPGAGATIIASSGEAPGRSLIRATGELESYAARWLEERLRGSEPGYVGN